MERITALKLVTDDSLKQEKQLLEGVFEKTGLACIAGATDTGKSMLLRDFAISISQEEDSFLGFKLNRKTNNVIFVSTEDGKSKTAELLRIQTEGLIDESLNRIHFLFNPDDAYLETKKALKDIKSDIVFVDCFQDAFQGDPIKSNDVRNYLNKWQKLSEEEDCLIVFLHHTNKRSEFDAPSKHNLNGGQGFQAKIRTVVELRADPVDKTKRHFCIVKGNYLKTEQKDRSFVLYFDNESLRFTSKGERANYNTLYEPKIDFERINLFKKAALLKSEGLTNKNIAPHLNLSEATISRLLNEGKEKGWQIDESQDNEDSEQLVLA
jgi:RecA-family ATPase